MKMKITNSANLISFLNERLIEFDKRLVDCEVLAIGTKLIDQVITEENVKERLSKFQLKVDSIREAIKKINPDIQVDSKYATSLISKTKKLRTALIQLEQDLDSKNKIITNLKF
jgi:hypothetical protein